MLQGRMKTRLRSKYWFQRIDELIQRMHSSSFGVSKKPIQCYKGRMKTRLRSKYWFQRIDELIQRMHSSTFGVSKKPIQCKE